MTDIRLSNRLAVSLLRTSYEKRLVELPPEEVQPNTTLSWPVDGTGSVTYQLAVAVGGEAGTGGIREPIRRLTLAWSLSPAGEVQCAARDVARTLKVAVERRPDGVSCTVNRRHRRVPPPPRRRVVARLIPAVAGIVLVALVAGTLRALGSTSGAGATATAIATATATATPVGSHSRQYTISLTASQATAAPRSSVTLTATSKQTLSGSRFGIEIAVQGMPSSVKSCPGVSTCSVAVTSATPATVTYVAYVDAGDQHQIQATSNVVSLVWTTLPPPTFTLSLTASKTTTTINTPVTLTASSTPSVTGTGYQIDIAIQGAGNSLQHCASGTSCSWPVTQATVTTITYVALIDRSFGSTPLRTSNTVRVAWTSGHTLAMTEHGTAIFVASNNNGMAQASCPSGEQMTGGGFDLVDGSSNPSKAFQVAASFPVNQNTWEVDAFNADFSSSGEWLYMSIFCAKANFSLNTQIVTGPVTTTAVNGVLTAVAACPAGTTVIGGGMSQEGRSTSYILASTPAAGQNAWKTVGFAPDGGGILGAYALCASQDVLSSRSISASIAIGPGQTQTIYLSDSQCSSNQALLAAGFSDLTALANPTSGPTLVVNHSDFSDVSYRTLDDRAYNGDTSNHTLQISGRCIGY